MTQDYSAYRSACTEQLAVGQSIMDGLESMRPSGCEFHIVDGTLELQFGIQGVHFIVEVAPELLITVGYGLRMTNNWIEHGTPEKACASIAEIVAKKGKRA